MSTRGAKGAKAVHAVGGTDGGDFSHRQVLAPRYEAMAGYRSGLRGLFVVVPLVYAVSLLLTVVHFTAPGLVAMSKQFLMPFPVGRKSHDKRDEGGRERAEALADGCSAVQCD